MIVPKDRYVPHCQTTSTGGYKLFAKKHGRKKLAPSEYLKIVNDFNWWINKKLLTETRGVTLPYGLGWIGIVAVQNKTSKRKKLNYVKWATTGIKEYWNNTATDNLSCRYIYSIAYAYNFPTKECWVFHPIKQFKQKLAKHFRENYYRYRRIVVKDELD